MTELQKIESSVPAVFTQELNDAPIDNRDLILPKILLMQGLSQAVADGKAIMGEMRDSLDSKLLGNKEKPIEVIPFAIQKAWILFEIERGKLEYKGQVAFSPENANWEWEVKDEKGNAVGRRDQCINVYCVLPGEIPTGMFLPYLISFRRTSYQAGRKIITAKELLRQGKRHLASKVFSVSCKKTENEQGSFYVFDASMGRDTTQQEMEAVAPWLQMIQSARVSVDDSDLKQEQHAAASTVGTAGGDIAF